jgi:predicted nuclease of predicted toxin-antitoxin system
VKFKLDENLPVELLDDLRAAGHEAESVLGERLTGAEDSVLLDHVRREGRVLPTMDKGIGDVRAYPPHLYAGIVLFRPPSSGRSAVLGFVRRHLPLLLERAQSGRLLVITERSARMR